MPYVGEGKLLETCGDFFDQNCVEGSKSYLRSPHIVEDAGDVHTCVE